MTQKTKKRKEYDVLVEFQPATYVHVMAESEAKAVDLVNKLVDERRLDFDRDSIRDDLLENVVKISCGDEFIEEEATKVSKAPESRDPFRFGLTFVPREDVDDLNMKQFANSVVNYPTETSWVRAKKITDDLGDRFIIYGQFHNDRGHTVNVDDCLERFNMRHWRVIADEITRLLLKRAGLDDAGINRMDWPTPEVTVTKTADVNNDDCIDLVKFEWQTLDQVVANVIELPMAKGAEEFCPHCEAVVKFIPSVGKDIIICPSCGKAIAACSTCNNHANCGDPCEAEKICDRIYNAKEVHV